MSGNLGNRLASASLILCSISILLWLLLSFGDTLDEEETFANVAILVGILAAVPAFISFVRSRKLSSKLPALVKVAASAALVCLLWNLGFVVLLLYAYGRCPNGIC